MKLYYPFSTSEDTPISINYYMSEQPVRPHMHDFHELVLVLKGSCRFSCEGVESVLIPGDLYVIEPHHEHMYFLDGPFECYNLMYRSELMGAQWERIQRDTSLNPDAPDADRTIARGETLPIPEPDDLSRQNILHLSAAQILPFERILAEILEEQQQLRPGYEAVQLALVELLSVYIKRAQREQFLVQSPDSSVHAALVEQVLEYIEAHLTEPIHFDALAERYHLSPGHFRRIFKQSVGLSPVEYMNRLRIVKSFAYLQDKDLTIADAGAAVGIHDPNYYSRLFKKTIGYSPRYFKDSAPQTAGHGG